MTQRTTADKWFEGSILAALIVVALVMLFPFYYITAVSFTSPIEYLKKPSSSSQKNGHLTLIAICFQITYLSKQQV